MIQCAGGKKVIQVMIKIIQVMDIIKIMETKEDKDSKVTLMNIKETNFIIVRKKICQF